MRRYNGAPQIKGDARPGRRGERPAHIPSVRSGSTDPHKRGERLANARGILADMPDNTPREKVEAICEVLGVCGCTARNYIKTIEKRPQN